MSQQPLSIHILPNASTMVGVCLTAISLVKIAEPHIGPSQVDIYLSLNAVFFLVSAFTSYYAIKHDQKNRKVAHFYEKIADLSFVIGLTIMTIIGILFALAIL